MSKPTVVICADVYGWAWSRKADNLKKYLSDEFDITIIHTIADGIHDVGKAHPNKDIYMTFSAKNDLRKLMSVPKEKRISGVTVWYPNMDDVLKAAHTQVDHITANNMILYNKVMESGLFKYKYYTPNGVDENVFKPSKVPMSSALTIGHVGKPTPWKNFARIIQPAFDLAKKSFGANIELKVNQRRYKDALSQEEMVKWYQDIDVFVMASGREEGTPNPALEAAACGKPILGTYSGNMPELIDEHNGCILDCNVHKYSEAFTKLAKNKVWCYTAGLKMRETIIKSWSWEILAENYRKLFRRVINRG